MNFINQRIHWESVSSPEHSSTLVAFTHVCQIINKFQDFHFEKSSILENSVFPFTNFCYLKFIFFQNFSISENNIIHVKVAKVVGKLGLFGVFYVFQVFSSDGGSCIETIMGTWFTISC